jgi:hypothetical protein
MSKCVANIGYDKYVLETKDAIALFEILSKAERYDAKYHGSEGDKPSFYTYHIWEQTEEESKVSLTMLGASMYRIAKMAGKP